MEPGRDIEIKFTGVRPGERLHEILFAPAEPITEIGIEGIVAARPLQPSIEALRSLLRDLENCVVRGERSAIDQILRNAVPEFQKDDYLEYMDNSRNKQHQKMA